MRQFLTISQPGHGSTNRDKSSRLCLQRIHAQGTNNTHSLWWKGPPWLFMVLPRVPPQALNTLPVPSPGFNAVCLSVNPSSQTWLEDRNSSYLKLLKITAWIFRFISNIKASQNKLTLVLVLSPVLTVSELKTSKFFLHSQSQRRCFPEELNRLSSRKALKPSSPLRSINYRLRTTPYGGRKTDCY